MQRQFQNIPYDTNNMINNALFAQQVTTFKSLTILKSLTTLFAHSVFFSNNLFILWQKIHFFQLESLKIIPLITRAFFQQAYPAYPLPVKPEPTSPNSYQLNPYYLSGANGQALYPPTSMNPGLIDYQGYRWESLQTERYLHT